MKILSVVGARPNFMKIAPIISAINEYNHLTDHPECRIKHLLLHTGQHYDEAMSRTFFKDLDLPEPDIYLGVGSASHAIQTAEIMKGFEPVLIKEEPDYVLVVGDVNSTIAAALVAKKMQIKVIHVEAGLRTFDMTMPEEINRILTDAISDILFITEESAGRNLLREGISKDKIHLVGNVMIDTLLKHKKKAESSVILSTLGMIGSEINGKIPSATVTNRNGGIGIKPYVLMTLHRPSNVDDADRLRGILEAILEVSKSLDVVFPVHPRTMKQIRKIKINLNNKLKLLEPLGYLDFLQLMAHAKMVMTDSGGIQEETTVLGVPCLTLRENTERPITITEGTNRLVGTNKEKIIDSAAEVLDKGLSNGRIPPLWDGKAAERIVQIILRDAES